MAKFIVSDSCSSLTLNGTEYEIIDGVVEVDQEIEFLLSNGFIQVEETVEETVEEVPTKVKGKK